MTTQLTIIHTASSMRWRMRRTDGPVLPFDIRGYPVVNPSMMDELGDRPGHGIPVCMPTRDEAVFSTSWLALVAPQTPDSDALTRLMADLSSFMRWLRVLCGQYQIPGAPSVVAVKSRLPLNSLQCPPLPDEEDSTFASVRMDLVTSAATLDQASDAAARVARGEPVPVPHHFFVDSIAAMRQEDYRISLLSAAIAVESLASEYLDLAYARRVAGGSGPEVRVVRIPQAGDVAAVKDPIYEALTARTDFGSLLHERPLYLTGRSLLIDQPQLYQAMRRLYATRNKIAHRGALAAADIGRCFDLCDADSEAALLSVGAVFRWFGSDPPPIHPRSFEPMRITEWGNRRIEI